MVKLIKRYWNIIRRPSVHFSLGFLTVGGFIGGILFWGAFNNAMEFTNTEKFFTRCHEMRGNALTPHPDPDDRPAGTFDGTTTVHTGPDSGTSLLLPVIPTPK